jgi:hypothetical protein
MSELCGFSVRALVHSKFWKFGQANITFYNEMLTAIALD